MTVHADRDRLIDLLVSHATEGLNDRDHTAMSELAGHHPDVERRSFETTAALIDMVFANEAGTEETLPEHLQERLNTQASTFASRPRPAEVTSRPFAPWIGWALSAAAAVIVLLLVNTPSDETPATPAERLAALEREPGVLRATFAEAAEGVMPGASGDVTWSDRAQVGYMRFRGLPGNDPTRMQYQLWIVDPKRGKQPVDGGVFDIPANADEAVIPIDAKLLVNSPQAFVVTAEQPGGVVVSDGPFLLIAKP